MKKQIVRRTYTVDNGEKSDLVLYVAYLDATGQEMAHPDIKRALRMDDAYEYGHYSEGLNEGTYQNGDKYSYFQEIIEVEFNEEEKLQVTLKEVAIEILDRRISSFLGRTDQSYQSLEEMKKAPEYEVTLEAMLEFGDFVRLKRK